MLEWIIRGLRKGSVTTRYPKRPEPPPDGFRGHVDVRDDTTADASLTDVCPTGAITVDTRGRIELDRSRCILCGDCVRSAPDRFSFSPRYETAARSRERLVVGDIDATRVGVDELHQTLAARAAGLRRSIHVRHIDCGSDGSEEWEIQALWNPYYDIQRLGFFLTNAPRHADVLLVTGPITAPMREPLRRTWEVMPEPKALVAVGTDACAGGLHLADGITSGGVDTVLAVDVYVPGSPPAPIAIMHALMLATGLLTGDEVPA
jgi:Ni,Fe-hydrogenase III small subunit/formate hydrogenlyase subunit 6/NADH:ubiquinone oxidoreductase subunit I